VGNVRGGQLHYIENLAIQGIMWRWWYQYTGGGATRSLPRDGGVEELHGDPTVGPHPKVWNRS